VTEVGPETSEENPEETPAETSAFEPIAEERQEPQNDTSTEPAIEEDPEDIPAEKPEPAKGDVSIKPLFNPFVKVISTQEAAALISSFTPPPVRADFKP